MIRTAHALHSYEALPWSDEAVLAGGQFFNLFNLGKTPEAMKDLQTKELKNGARMRALEPAPAAQLAEMGIA